MNSDWGCLNNVNQIISVAHATTLQLNTANARSLLAWYRHGQIHHHTRLYRNISTDHNAALHNRRHRNVENAITLGSRLISPRFTQRPNTADGRFNRSFPQTIIITRDAWIDRPNFHLKHAKPRRVRDIQKRVFIEGICAINSSTGKNSAVSATGDLTRAPSQQLAGRVCVRRTGQPRHRVLLDFRVEYHSL